MRGGRYQDFRGVSHVRPKNPATCTHPNVEMVPGRNIGWCKTCFATIRDYSNMPAPEQTKDWQSKPAERGQRVKASTGEYVLVTRIDLQATANGLVSHKFADGWFERRRNTDLGLRCEPKWTLEAAVAWLEAHGYTVRRWPGGARAWLGEILPVRNKAQIIMLRNQLAYEVPHDPTQYHALDLAYDL